MKKMIVCSAAVLMAILVIVLVVTNGKANPPQPADQQASDTPSENVTEPTAAARKASYQIDVPYLSQVGRYPCGCESVSAVMALNYAGFSIDVDTFISSYLPQGTEPYYAEDGLLHADSPYEVFIGSPYDEYSYGCYAPVIARCLTSLLQDNGTVNTEPGSAVVLTDLSGMTLSQLCDDYVSRDIPVIVWGTIGMNPVSDLTTWILPDGSEFTWKSREHCLLLVGYNDDCYYFNDPMEGKSTAYRKADAENAYKELYSQALALVPQQ